ncbi:Aryl hydrocarbon receptor [Liparis tanakae]|uniref:Aryl hydrocarbon receptor n=1 Tax=Liparis tanakae TaxID=230148 RepID=A0A4Z2HRH0_9TELE|nr:Aryl hydrocarbon receptor [Liparis tanakae]
MVHQNVHDLVHTEDREMFRCQLHFALKPSDAHSDVRSQDGQSSSKAGSSSGSSLPQYVPPENSSFLDRSFCCRLRCLLDNASGFLALNFNGRLKYLHLQGSSSPPQLALFAIATPLQPPSVMAIRTKTLIFQSKHRMDFAPMGIDTRGKLVLGYTEVELVTTGSGYQFIHAADMIDEDRRQRLHVLPAADQSGPLVVGSGQRPGVLYDVALEPIPGLPGGVSPGAAEQPAAPEKPLDPASLLGSLLRQDCSVYSRPPEPSVQLPAFGQIEDEDEDLEPPPSAVERAFLDSHAVLSVPSQTRGSRAVAGESVMDSLEQILGDIVDGGLEGLDVEESELRDWEDTLARLSDERDGVSGDVNHILANDVFSYVEEALRRESAPQGSLPASGSFDASSVHAQHPGSAWQRAPDATSLFAQQAPFGDALERCRNAPRGHSSAQWPPGSGGGSSNRGNQTMSTHAHTRSRPPSVSVYQTTQYTLTGSQQLQGPPAWQQLHRHTPTHSSHAGRSSCMYERREGGEPSAGRSGRSGPLLGPPCSRGNANVLLVRPRAGGDLGPGAAAGRTDVDDVRSGAARSEFPLESGTIQSSFFCWTGDAQISNVSMNGVVDPFAFSALSTGSFNLHQNSGT